LENASDTPAQKTFKSLEKGHQRGLKSCSMFPTPLFLSLRGKTDKKGGTYSFWCQFGGGTVLHFFFLLLSSSFLLLLSFWGRRKRKKKKEKKKISSMSRVA